jgi:hypothetical protein
MTNGDEKPIDTGDSEQGILDHEASIWEVLRKSEEKIRVEKKRLAEERTKVEETKETLFKEKDNLAKQRKKWLR